MAEPRSNFGPKLRVHDVGISMTLMTANRFAYSSRTVDGLHHVRLKIVPDFFAIFILLQHRQSVSKSAGRQPERPSQGCWAP